MPHPAISVIVPAYNTAATIGECIDSILAQTFTDFDLIIADDGSTDNTCEIISRYKDPRMRLLRREHGFIDTLNALLYEAKGKYIACMDDDDIMMPDRLRLEYEYMEAHPEVAVVGGGMEFFSDKRFACLGKRAGNGKSTSDEKIGKAHAVTAYDLLDSCGIYNPTAMIRSEVLCKYGLKYEREYIYAQDFRLWTEFVKRDQIIHSLDNVLIRYRTSETQASSRYAAEQMEHSREIQDSLMQWIKEREEEVKRDYEVVPVSGNKLSVCMSFLNEGEEVGNTVRSIRETAGDTVDIIAVNDASTDGYDYEADLKGLNVHYFVNKRRIGAAAGKEKAVQISSTPYFILIDAHMRFYQKDWASQLVAELEKNSNRLLCCQNLALSKKGGRLSKPVEMGVCAAYLRFDLGQVIPQIKWNDNEDIPSLDKGQIPAVLGATYSTSTEYWNKLCGYQGLIHYGDEEAYISIKAWMEGGGCYFLPNIKIGHIYREKSPYIVHRNMMTYNILLIGKMFMPSLLSCFSESAAIGNSHNAEALARLFSSREEEIHTLCEKYSKSFKHDFSRILEINSILLRHEEKEAKLSAKRLPQIKETLLEWSREKKEAGLYDGLMADALVFAMYADAFNDQRFEEEAERILLLLLDRIKEDMPLTLTSGIPGIGWGLLYLISNNIIEDDMEETLRQIDRKVMERSLVRTEDNSLRNGCGGILAYVSTRLYYSKDHKGAFTTDYLEELKAKAHALSSSKDIDFRTRAYAMLLLEITEKECRFVNFPLTINFIADAPKTIPEDLTLCPQGLTGLHGFALETIRKHQMITNKQ